MLSMTTSTAGILIDIYAANLILILKPDNPSPMLREDDVAQDNIAQHDNK
jgi:hypothetical protein